MESLVRVPLLKGVDLDLKSAIGFVLCQVEEFEAIRLVFVEGLPIHVAATAMGKSKGTVFNRIASARKRLSRVLAER